MEEVDVKMIIKRGELMRIFCLVLMLLVSTNLILAGVGIKWEQESALVNENGKTCLTYKVYNPWPEESYVTIEVSDESGEIKEILTEQESEKKLVPANTGSSEAIPIKFCFKVPKIYKRDCLVGSFICKQECNEEQKVYEGEVLVKSIYPPTEIGGAGGSATSMAVSAPLKIRVRCNFHSRNFTLIYIVLALISAFVIGIVLYRRYRKPASERDKEKLKRLQEKIRKQSKHKK
jgi:hypothetical protein